MRKAIHISIPEPCHEDWNTMTPELKGRHCSVCEKTVFDFTAQTDEYIVKTFEQESELCGRFKNSQLDRELAYSRKDSNNYLTYLASTLFAFIAFGSNNGYAQGGPIQTTQSYSNPIKVKGKSAHSILKERLISGTILDENGLPMPGVKVKINSNTYISDFDGKFKLKTKLNNIPLQIKANGYITQELIISNNSKNELLIKMIVDVNATNEYVIRAGRTDIYYQSKQSKIKSQQIRRQRIRNGELERTKVGTFLYTISTIFRKRK